jgi:hypothetical protein
MRMWMAVVIALAGCDSGKQDNAKPAPPPPRAPASDAAMALVQVDAATVSGIQVFGVGESPMSIAVVGDTLFWTDSAGAIWSMPKVGGRILQLSNQHEPGRPFYQNIAAHTGDLVAAKEGDLVRVKPSQGPLTPMNLGLGSDQLLELVSDGTAVYATSYETNKIYRIANDKATKLLDHRRAGIAVRGDTLYALSYSTGVLVAVKTSGGSPRTIATGLPKPTGFDIDDTNAYAWCEKDGTLRRVDLKTGKHTILAKDGLENSDNIVEDGEWIYLYTWLGPGAGKLLRVAKDGSKSEVIADKLSAPYDIAIDDEAVFVSVRDDNKILRLPKAAIKAL